MEGSENWLSPSKSSASPKPSGENDENEMIPKFQNQKKTHSKHFMSPTISAASKAAPPRKKILTERNENINNSDAQHHKTSDLDKKRSPRNWDTDFSDNSYVKAYDPMKNYLSPRPKYLRFNPNRRHEIFNRLEKEELNDSFDSQEVNGDEIKDSSFSHRKGSVEKPENEENNVGGDENNICNDYEEEEDEIDERGWCFKGLIKFVLTLTACALSTSYICTMNSQSPTAAQHGISKVKDGSHMIKRQTLEVIGMKMFDAGSLEMGVKDDYDEFKEGGSESIEVEIIEYDFENEFSIEEEKIREFEERVEVEVIENDVENLERVENEESVDVGVNEIGVKNLDKVEIDKDNNGEIDDIVKVEIGENDAKNLEKGDNELVENENEISEDEIDNDAENEGARSDQLEIKPENSDQLVDAKNDKSGNAKEMVSSNPALNEDNVGITEASENEIEYVTESYEQSKSSETNEIEKAGKLELDTELKGSHENSTNSVHEVENEKMGRKISSVIGFSLVSITLASLGIIVSRLKKKPRNASLAEKSEPVLKSTKSAVEEKKKIEFIARPSVSHSNQETRLKKLLDNQHICAPTVELIGEIVVGKVSNTEYLPKFGTLARPVLASSQLSGNEYSDINSSSYGSFTTETKILKKEGGGQNGESIMEVTPVRRSSRLRSRGAVMSP